MLRNVIKLAVFIGLVAGFLWFTKASLDADITRAERRASFTVTAMFVGGAVLTLWGDKRIGVLDPISLRGLFVVLGVLLMIFSLILASGLKKNREPNQSVERTESSRFARLQFEHQWRLFPVAAAGRWSKLRIA